MGTADTGGYMNDDYDIESAKHATEEKRHKLRCLLEPVAIALVIFAYCLLQAWAQNRDEKHKNAALQAEIEKLKTPTQMVCVIKQNNVLHQYPNCTVINKKYAQAY